MKSEVTIANSYLSHILYSDTINTSKGEKSGQCFAYTKERYVFFLNFALYSNKVDIHKTNKQIRTEKLCITRLG